MSKFSGLFNRMGRIAATEVLRSSIKKDFLFFAIDVIKNLEYIRCADFKNDLTFAELALVFEIIWIHLLKDNGNKTSDNGPINTERSKLC